MALTTDVITQYAYARSYNYLAEDDFKLEWKETLIGAMEKGALLRQFPWMVQVMDAMPDWLVALTNPGMGMLFSWQRDVRRQVESILETKDPNADKSTKTIFHTLRDSSLPSHEKTLDRLSDEGDIGRCWKRNDGKDSNDNFILFVAKQGIATKLTAELRTALPNPPDYCALVQARAATLSCRTSTSHFHIVYRLR
jgi:hypothetical protein